MKGRASDTAGAWDRRLFMWRCWIVAACLIAFLGTGCSTMGEWTGKTVKSVENAAGDFKSGYRKGKTQ
ncbi:MAG TPA: hypothetical protein DGF30_07125 [Desulfomicrobium sp.]|nr:hypothetical protein [Desulfomicrobium sp.]